MKKEIYRGECLNGFSAYHLWNFIKFTGEKIGAVKIRGNNQKYDNNERCNIVLHLPSGGKINYHFKSSELDLIAIVSVNSNMPEIENIERILEKEQKRLFEESEQYVERYRRM